MSVVNGTGAGATFCLAAGTYQFDSTGEFVKVQNGDDFYGVPGTMVDGELSAP
ncbi:hypothetical protein BH24ACT26_BH24ACT26_01320 [soil metagenome]